MKRAAIISMAAFYLLLTTGMFVCIVHCSAQSMVSKSPMAMAHTAAGMHTAKKLCNGNKDCGCCKKHGNYVVKENIKPGFELQFAQAGVLVEQAASYYSYSNRPVIRNTALIESKVPPWKTGKLISIQNHSLQI